MNEHILATEVQDYIHKHRQTSVTTIALQKSPFAKISSQEIATQIDAWQRAVKKLPTWAHQDGIYFPARIHIEQSSSEHTAIVKQTLIKKGARVIDLTGGMGVDSCYMAQEASSLIHCERNKELSEIASYNAEVLQVNNMTCKNVDGISYLTSQPDNYFDYIYVDPSRRKSTSKVFLLDDCEPNILKLQDLFFAKADTIITKLSPLLDISSAIQALQGVESVYIISLDNDCKELVIKQSKGYLGQPTLRAVRLYKDLLQDFSFTYLREKATVSEYSLPKKWLYDPDVAITKAGAFKCIAIPFKLFKLAQHTHLYTSVDYHKEFPGRVFEIIDTLSFNDFKKNPTVKKANIIVKNFPLDVLEIRKRYKIADGGNLFCFFTRDQNDRLLVIEATRVL